MTKCYNIYSIRMAWGVRVKDYDTHILNPNLISSIYRKISYLTM